MKSAPTVSVKISKIAGSKGENAPGSYLFGLTNNIGQDSPARTFAATLP